MKKYLYSAMMLGLVAGFSSCETDQDNPTLDVKSLELTLNTPSFAGNGALVLYPEDVNMTFNWSCTGYTFPYVSTYVMELSTDPSFSSSIIVPLKDNGSAAISSNELNKTLQQMGGWSDNDVPESVNLYGRVTCKPSSTAVISEEFTIYSNVLSFNVRPRYQMLKAADPEMWYILGGNIGTGAWSNNADNIYINNIPFALVQDCEYDINTGKGEITYTGYFLASQGFKILPSSFDWNYAMCGNGTGNIVYRNGGDDTGNIEVAADGYYTININTTTYECTLTPYDKTPKVFGGMAVSGSFNGWSDSAMTPINTVDGMNNHQWIVTLDLAAGDQIKFKEAGSWDTNWGFGSGDGDVNTWGYGVQGGPNIGIAEGGTYQLYLNDITGYFYITKK